MGNWQISFQYPWFLLLLLLIPIIWYIGSQSLAGLGKWRQWIAIGCRSLVTLLVILALAGIQWVWVSEDVTVIYLLDQSDSIPSAKRQLMLRFALENVNKHRDGKNKAGLIVFGREASIEFPPLDDVPPPITQPESLLGATDATNLESAMKLAQATFPEDTARRVVLITDGNETLGTSSAVAQNLVDAGIGIDVVPIRLESDAEILIEKIDVPGNVRQGQPIDAKVVIQRYSEDASTEVSGQLRVVRSVGNAAEVLYEGGLTLDRDVNVIPIPDKIEQAAGYTYSAEFIPDDKRFDAIAQNNRATAFTHARGKGRVLLIEDSANLGNFDVLVEALRRSDIEVEVRDTSSLFTSIVELQAYDSVILAGLPRTSGEDASAVQSFSDEQIEMLISNTQQFGAGILMIGGPEAFGAGGWANSKLEEAMPVDFQIKNDKIEAVGALAMVLHASEIPEGNYWQKVIARASLDVLGPMDYCGVVEYSAVGDKWMWGGKNGMLRVGPNKRAMRGLISRMTPGDMPDFEPAMRMALTSLKATTAATKHMIIISDGDPSPASKTVLDGFAAEQIKVSTVAVGAHGQVGHAELQRIATITGGSYYVVRNPSALPKIFVREARRVAKPLIFEPEGGVMPQTLFRHEVLQGVSDFPRIRGFVMTQIKESSLVELPVLSPAPAEKENATLLSMWTYGLGRTAVLTTDAGNRWANEWVNWSDYDKFFSQLVRWTMRPTIDEGQFQLASRISDGKVQVIVNALDDDDNFLNFLDMSAVGVTPDLKPFPIVMRQQAPGRYVGEFDATESGSYMVSVSPGPGQAPITSGVTVPFSEEYRLRQANFTLLNSLADLPVQGGDSGMIGEPLEDETFDQLVDMDTFRSGLPPAKSLTDIWPWVVLLGATLFFADVFVRRVAIDPGVPIRYLASKFRPKADASAKERESRIARLRGQKSAVHEELDKRRASTQFEPETIDESTSEVSAFDAAAKPTADVPRSQPKADGLAADESDSGYTSRLLKAKRDAAKRNPNAGDG